MLKINGQEFEIEYAFMDALLDYEKEEKLFFGLEICCKKIDDKTLPSVTSDKILKIGKNEIKEWHDIAGRVIEWEKYSKNIWKPHLKFYNCYKNTFRGNFIYNARTEIKKINNKVFVKIDGTCDSKFNAKEMQTLNLEIETEVKLKTIQAGPHKSEELARNRLNSYLDSRKYIYSVSKLELSNNNSVEMGGFDLKQ
jgi:hypothetical protein